MHWMCIVFPVLAVAGQTILGVQASPSGLIDQLKVQYNLNKVFDKFNFYEHSVDLENENYDDSKQLNATLVPLLYKVHLDFDTDFLSCTGSVEIDLIVLAPTKEIHLHAWKETIHRASAYVSFNGHFSNVVTDIEYTNNNIAKLFLKSPLLPESKYTLHLNFENPFGLFVAAFNKSDKYGTKSSSWIAVSRNVVRSESTHLLFPCFTERSMKANFSMMITHDLNYTALTNMPVESMELDTKTTTYFQTSPKMSAHLVTIAIMDLNLHSGLPMSQVWAPDFGGIIQPDIVQSAISEMESFTKIKLPLPKIDHVIVPSGLVSSYEGGWGLLLYDEEDPTLKKMSLDDRTAVTTISKAVASQWFGGLVTASSWGYHWLDEGFSNFFGLYLSDKMGNEAWDEFLVDDLQDTLFTDAYPKKSKPITADSYSFYGSISPNKGAAFLRMVAELITIDKFKLAVQKYLAGNAFRNVIPDDLFKILEAANESHLPSNLRFTDFAESWTKQAGYPLVNVTRNYQTGEVVLTQERFFASKQEEKAASFTRWWIPLSWMTGNETVHFTSQKWLRADTESATLTLTPGESSFLLNLRSVGYFRINYDIQNWLYLAKDMRATRQRFPVANRAQIIDDAYALSTTGHVTVTVVLEILRILEKEMNPFVWATGIKIISSIRNNVMGTEAYPLLEKFIQQLMKFAFTANSGLITNEPYKTYKTARLQSEIAYLACASGVEECIRDASKNFERYKDNIDSIPSDEFLPTLCGMFKKADEPTFWELRGLIKDERTSPNLNMLHTLAHCTDDKLLIKAHLKDLFLNNGTLSKNIMLSEEAIDFVSSSPLHWDSYFEYLHENIEELIRARNFNARRLVKSMASNVKTLSQYEKVKKWVEDHYIPKSGDKNIIKLLDDIPNESMTWNERHLEDVKSWITDLHFEKVTTLHPGLTTSSPDRNPSTPTSTSDPVNGSNRSCFCVALLWFACMVHIW